MYSLTLTYLGAPIARLAAVANFAADPAVKVSVSAVGSKWDDGGELPLSRDALEAGARPPLQLTATTPLGAQALMEWPANLPLGELLQLCFRSELLGELNIWARVEGIRLHRQPMALPQPNETTEPRRAAAA